MNKNNIWRSLGKLPAACLLIAGVIMSACTKIDDYKEKYVSGGETTYTGKLDSITVYSGNNRVMFRAMLSPDPRVTFYRVYWGGRADSATFQVTSSSSRMVQEYINNVPEGEQTFEFVSYDAAGHNSVSTFKNGSVYGSRYQESLLNRKIVSSALDPDLQTGITFAGMDKATGAVLTEIKYLDNNGDSLACSVPLDVTDTVLMDHKYGSEINYRTLYVPDSTSIDTFYTPYDVYQPVSGSTWINLANKIILNPGSPFTQQSWDGSRWGVLAGWTTTADVKNASGGNGGYELRGGVGVLSMEGGWGLPAVPNGKIYQVIHLPYAGQWKFSAPIDALSSTGTKYLVVNNGTDVPDIGNITTASYYTNFSTVAAGTVVTVEFTVDEPTDICIGFVATMPDTGTYFKVKTVSLSYFKQ